MGEGWSLADCMCFLESRESRREGIVSTEEKQKNHSDRPKPKLIHTCHRIGNLDPAAAQGIGVSKLQGGQDVKELQGKLWESG